MNARNDGGPAFPGAWENDSDMNATAPDGRVVPPMALAHLQGMTLRDYFAAAALTGIVDATFHYGSPAAEMDRARAAYWQADAMIEARRT